MKVLNFGSLNIDYTYEVDHFVRGGETLSSAAMQVFSGGKGLNQSIALKKSGVEVWHAGAVGESDGNFLLKQLEAAGVHADFVARTAGKTGHAIIQKDKHGQNCILLYGGANQEITLDQVDRVMEYFEEGDFLILQNEISQISYIMEKAHERGLTIVLNPSPMDEKIASYPLEYVDYFLLNEIEARELIALDGKMGAGHKGSSVKSLSENLPVGSAEKQVKAADENQEQSENGKCGDSVKDREGVENREGVEGKEGVVGRESAKYGGGAEDREDAKCGEGVEDREGAKCGECAEDREGARCGECAENREGARCGECAEDREGVKYREYVKDVKDGRELLGALSEKFKNAAIVLTLGEEGAWYQNGETILRQPVYKVDVVDTTAAGDTFTGYFIGSLARQNTPEKALDLAAKAASIAVTRMGAAPSIPDLEEVLSC